MKFTPWPKRDSIKNYFPLPNELYHLGLVAGEIAIYGYLLSIEDRETYQCWPSYKTIGKAVKMSPNTVRKYVAGLEEKRLLTTQPTTIRTKDGRVRNGNLLYTIRPIQEAVDLFHERQLAQLDTDPARQRAAERLNGHSYPCHRQCGPGPGHDRPQCGRSRGFWYRGQKRSLGTRPGTLDPQRPLPWAFLPRTAPGTTPNLWIPAYEWHKTEPQETKKKPRPK